MVECIVKQALANKIRELRNEQFMKEVFEPEPSREDMDYYHWNREKTGAREASNKLAKEVWDKETEDMIRSCYYEW